MLSMTKSRGLDKVQRQDTDVNRRHYGEDVKFYLLNSLGGFSGNLIKENGRKVIIGNECKSALPFSILL